MKTMTNLKTDKRPACLGWCPGEYLNQCRVCDAHFIGDKRAVNCADCAYKQIEKFTPKVAVDLFSTCNSILFMIGNIDHSIGNGEHSAKLRGDLLNDIRTLLKSALDRANTH